MYLQKVPVLASSDVADLCPVTLFFSSSVTVLQHPRPPGSLSDTPGSVSCWAFACTVPFVWKAIPTNAYVAGFIHSFHGWLYSDLCSSATTRDAFPSTPSKIGPPSYHSLLSPLCFFISLINTATGPAFGSLFTLGPGFHGCVLNMQKYSGRNIVVTQSMVMDQSTERKYMHMDKRLNRNLVEMIICVRKKGNYIFSLHLSVVL